MPGLLDDDLMKYLAPAGYSPIDPASIRLGNPSFTGNPPPRDMGSLQLGNASFGGPPGGAPQLTPMGAGGGGPMPPPMPQGGPPGGAPGPSAPGGLLDPSTLQIGGGAGQQGAGPQDQAPQVAPGGQVAPPTSLLAPGAPGTAEAGGPNPQPPQGLLSRLMGPDPEGVTMRDKLMALGSIMKGDSAGAQKTLSDARAQGQRQIAFQQIDSMFPNNPTMRMAMRLAPEEAIKFLMPQKVGKGERFVQPGMPGAPGAPGGASGAPGGQGADVMDYGVANDVPYTVDSNGQYHWQGAAPANAAQIEANRHNLTDEQIQQGRLDYEKLHGGQENALRQQEVGLKGAELGLKGTEVQTGVSRLNMERVNQAHQMFPNLPIVSDEGSLAKLQPGTTFIAPNGDRKIVPQRNRGAQ